MTIAWMLYVLLVGTLLAIGAVAVASALTLRGRATRWVWAATLMGIASFAVVAPRVQSVSIAVAEGTTLSSRGAHSAAATSGDIWSAARAARVLVESATAQSIAGLGARLPSGMDAPVVIGWLLASALLLAIYLLVNVRLSRARGRWPLQTLQGHAVRVAPAAGPAVIGLVRAEIVVPRSLLERSATEQRLIVDHEHEHLRAGDHLLLGVACLAAIAFPWHPAVWYALARLRLAIELDCDARVLRRGAAPRTYGALLIDMAARGAGIRVGTLALADRPSHLERRLLAMKTTRSRFVLLRTSALGAGAALLVLAACEAKVPTATDVAAMDVASAEKSAAEAGLMRPTLDGRADFFVNGVKVSASQARAMEAKNIGSIEVVKSELASGRDTIFVTTADRMPPRTELERAPRGAKELDESGQTFFRKTQSSDSSEHLLAHVEGELARVRAEESAHPDLAPKSGMKMRARAGSDAEPMFMIDGKKVSSAQFAAIRQEDLAAVSVYKGAEALKISSDPAAKNGIIMATTRAQKKN